MRPVGDSPQRLDDASSRALDHWARRWLRHAEIRYVQAVAGMDLAAMAASLGLHQWRTGQRGVKVFASRG
jgi:hypothetical protein